DVRALVRECDGACAADPAAPAGDDGYLSLQCPCHESSPERGHAFRHGPSYFPRAAAAPSEARSRRLLLDDRLRRVLAPLLAEDVAHLTEGRVGPYCFDDRLHQVHVLVAGLAQALEC